MNPSIADLRQNYTQGGLLETQVAQNPLQQFQVWFDAALAAKVLEANAMTLATITPEGRPSARMVLLKDFDQRGFVFFTNAQSAKGQHLQENPWAALVFWWGELERSVRIEGRVREVSPQESDRYFQSRPWESRLGAWASAQSQVIPSREILEQRLEDLKQKYRHQEVERPPHWGGFRVIPDRIEFWQGRPSRLHDRLCYLLESNGNWRIERLSP
jgi:pyridoxamine 5'-phosphate oxidase